MIGRRSHNLIIIFSRFPIPGKAKTRLIPELGEKGAADLQRLMTRQTLATVEAFCHEDQSPFKIYYEGAALREMRDWLGDHDFAAQTPGDLGSRLRRAFEEAFDAGHTRVVVIGSDCPGLTSKHIALAVASLETADLVVGPALDGGYYLVGLSRPAGGLFEQIPWGTAAVYQTTLDRGRQLNLSIELLEPLHDVDRPADLRHLNHHPHPQ